jgi:Ala-tRNA(Pro) deacylase
MLSRQLQDFLSENHVPYDVINHPSTVTAQQTAQVAHVSGYQVAKTVIVKLDDKMAMAVLPAPEYLDLDLLKAVAGAKKVRLAHEYEFKNEFPGCEVGAMPPFGNLYHMDVFVEEELSENAEITFNAGSHTELIRIAYRDFEDLVQPKVVRMSHSYVS